MEVSEANTNWWFIVHFESLKLEIEISNLFFNSVFEWWRENNNQSFGVQKGHLFGPKFNNDPFSFQLNVNQCVNAIKGTQQHYPQNNFNRINM